MSYKDNYYHVKPIGHGDIAEIGKSFGDTFGDAVSESYRTTANPTWKPRKDLPEMEEEEDW